MSPTLECARSGTLSPQQQQTAGSEPGSPTEERTILSPEGSPPLLQPCLDVDSDEEILDTEEERPDILTPTGQTEETESACASPVPSENSAVGAQCPQVPPLPTAQVTSSDTVLPWGAHKERSPYPSCVHIDMDIRPGEYVMRTLFAEFTVQAERKIEAVMAEPQTSLATEAEVAVERRGLAVEFLFCLVLIEVLKQLPFHPGQDDLVTYIETLAFRHFKYREGVQSSVNAANIHIMADLYAEVIGVLAQSRFMSVKKRFTAELKELRNKEASPTTTQSVISLLMGMKFFRVKMVPIEEFEASFQFMQECAQYFLEVKDKDIKHALAGLFVEILVPVAASVKNEVNVPCLKNFVEMLYSQTLDMCAKSKHRLAIFPLVTCLLCVSQKIFFLQSWHTFLAMCLSNLKNRDPKMSRVALESLYRLLWVYMIRIKCESNTATHSRLHSIVNSLFPKGSKAVVPRDTPLNIFVKIIQFIAQLLSVGRPFKVIMTPERMSIGLRAFLVVTDSLQQKEGEPPMPRTVGVLPSGNTLRVKKTYLNKMLTEDTARSIGMSSYFSYVRRTFDEILRALDSQFGRPLMMTNTQNVNKEPDELISGERKPRIDLFRTCVAAIPRLIPDGMTGPELVDMLARLTVHMDEELRALAYQSLQTLVIDFPDWRDDVVRAGRPRTENAHKTEPPWSVFHVVEGFALVILCHCRLSARRIAVHILREAKTLLRLLNTASSSSPDQPVVDVIDRSCAQVLERCYSMLPPAEKAAALSTFNVDLQWLADRSSSVWTAGDRLLAQCPTAIKHAWPVAFARLHTLFSVVDPTPVSDNRASLLRSSAPPKRPANEKDIYMHVWRNYVGFAFRVVPPAPSPVVRCASPDLSLSPSPDSLVDRVESKSPGVSIMSGVVGVGGVGLASGVLGSSFSSFSSVTSSSSNASTTTAATASPAALFKLVVPLLRCEVPDVRDAAVQGLGRVNPDALKDVMEELVPYIREAVDRKQENMRRRRRRDALRLHTSVLDRDSMGLHPTFVEYIDGVRVYLENEPDKDSSVVREIKLHFCNFLVKMLKSFSLDTRRLLLKRELRCKLFGLFTGWVGRFGLPLQQVSTQRWPSSAALTNSMTLSTTSQITEEPCTELEFAALQAMSSLLCCGPCFNPKGLGEEGIYYAWLDLLLDCSDEKAIQLCYEEMPE
ncbi:hypothetical protein B566_EDAN013957, partial [Ephemera danica]